MTADRFVSTQFCDDIRQEIGNKFSLIGCYGTVIHVDPLPSVLPKLCVAVKVYTPISKPFGKLTVRILRGDTVVGELPFQKEALAPTPTQEQPPGVQWQMIGAMVVISPFPVDGPCAIKVEAETEEETLSGGIIWIHGKQQAN